MKKQIYDSFDFDPENDADWAYDSYVSPPYTEQVQSDYDDDDAHDHDDMFDTDSALGSCGWGTDEYYE